MATTDLNRERDELKAVLARLIAAFAGTSSADVEDTVERAYHRFDGSKVRTFVPLLVERFARDELQHS